MIKERYVSSEVAMLLRDKGFNEGCNAIYGYDNNLHTNIFTCHNSEFEGCVTAPTQARACDWIEETFNIAILLDLTVLGYYPVFLNAYKDPNTASTVLLGSLGKDYTPMPCGDNSDGSWSSKELAYNEALKYVLTNLI